MYSVISGDIISFTSLTVADRIRVEEGIQKLLEELQKTFNTYSRIVRGDYLECVVPAPEEGLRIALIIKSFLKSLSVDARKYNGNRARIRQFNTHGIRLAIGLGKLSRFIPEEGVVDGEAVYFSGRAISGETTYDKERIVIKNTLFFVSANPDWNEQFKPLIGLLDVLLSKATARQCEVLYLKLLGQTEEEIADRLGIGQSAVNQHSTAVGWNAIEEATAYFKTSILKR